MSLPSGKPGGKLYTVIPGETHLYGLKQVVYDAPYYNDEKLPETNCLVHTATHKLTTQIRLNCQEDIMAVFQMTPYYYRTSENDKAKISQLSYLDTDISFVIAEYTK